MAAGLRSAIFAVRHRGDEAELRERVGRLLEFYAPLGIERVSLIRLPRLSALAGEVRFRPPAAGAPGAGPSGEWEEADDAFLLWGGPVRAGLDAGRLLAAGDRELRDFDATVAAFAAVGPRARLVTGCAGATALFESHSGGIEAWSSHAVAAGYLALGSAAIDPAALPQLFAAEFVGGTATHLRGVTAVPPASRIEFGPDAASRHTYWSARERFAPVPEPAASAAARSALLESLERRLAGAGDIELGLTAGADSRVAAVALRELGLPFQPVTMAAGPEAPDARGAARVAEALGAPHRIYRHEIAADEAAARLIDADARWSEGLAPLTGLGLSEGGTPAVFVTGGGGETGRAWYYRWQARNYRNPNPRQLTRVLGHLHWRIEGATPDAHGLLDDAIASWIASAQESGHAGWRVLDVLYENERLRRWGRTRLPRTPYAVLYAFSSPDVSRALLSLPLEDRISDGFHRAFLAKHAPGLGLDPPPAQRRGVPPALRRLISTARRRRGLAAGSRAPWFWADVWDSRPLNRGYIADEALSRDVLREAMGDAWVGRVRAGFLAGEDHATQMAFLATGVAALDGALESLR